MFVENVEAPYLDSRGEEFDEVPIRAVRKQQNLTSLAPRVKKCFFNFREKITIPKVIFCCQNLVFSFIFLQQYPKNTKKSKKSSLQAVLRIRIRSILMFQLELPDPDQLVRETNPDPSIIKQK
jgi:hypothetical protein